MVVGAGRDAEELGHTPKVLAERFAGPIGLSVSRE